MKLLIPAAKIVPLDLQNIGKLPAVIYPVNDGIVFDFLIDQYGDMVTEVDVLCYEKAAEVRKTLDSFKESYNIQFIELERIDDLGHTIYAGLGDEEEEIAINFGDTMVRDVLPLHKKDFIAYAVDYPDEAWTYFETSKGEITSICDKKTISGTDKKPLFVGVFKLHSSLYLKACLEKAFQAADKQMDSFYYALMLYSRRYPMESIPVQEWFDIGHTRKYFESKLAVRAREFNHISIDKDRGILRKTSENREKFIDEIKWYLKLPEDMEYVHPRIFSYSVCYEKPYVEMEYYSYHTLHELFLYGDMSYEQWDSIFRHIHFITNDFKRYQIKDSKLNCALQEMYLDKTLKRLDVLRSDIKFERLFAEPIVINGIRYRPLNEICEILKRKIPEFLYHVDCFYMIHGDLCFTNIMVDNNFSFIKLIDPRGRFGKYGVYGDERYEMAKILHSIDGKYDFIIKDLFKLELQKGTEFSFKVTEQERKFEIKEIFLSVYKDITGRRLAEIEMIEALLFLSMIPLHRENIRHQYAMLCTGILLLDRLIDLQVI